MRTDARSIFVVTLLVFLFATAWRVWVALQPAPPPPPAPPAEPVRLAPFRPLGVIGLVSNQFSAQALVVPVNPFRPTFETMVRNPDSGDLEAIVAGSTGTVRQATASTGRPPAPDWRGLLRQNPRPRNGRPDSQPAAPAPDAGPPPVPKFAFAGMFQRPDGRVAAYLKSTLGGGRFLVTGDQIGNCQVLNATADGVMLRQPDGTTRTLVQGDAPVELGGQ